MPTPILVALAVLIAYPLVQVVAIRLRRPQRLEFRELIDNLKTDPAYQGEPEQCVLTAIDDDAYGSPILYLLPVFFPILAVADILDPEPNRKIEKNFDNPRTFIPAFSDLRGLPTESPLWSDERLMAAMRMSISLGFASYPISVFLGGLISIPFVVVGLCLRWARTRTLDLLSLRELGLRAAYAIGALHHFR